MSAKLFFKQTLKSIGLYEPLKASIYGAKNAVHLYREFIYRLPNPLVKLRHVFTEDDRLKRARRELRREGIISLVLDSYLSEVKADFVHFIERVEATEPGPMKMSPDGGGLHPSIPYAEEGHDANAIITFSNDPFKHSSGFLRLALETPSSWTSLAAT